MKKGLVWLKASRIPAQAFIFPSLLLGQGLNYLVSNQFSVSLFIGIHVYGFVMHFFIVFANDYADYESDLKNTTFTPFTGGSRVLVQGLLQKKHLLNAAILMAILSSIAGIYLSIASNNFFILALILIGIALMFAYSFRPILLSYRGFGEVLQMLGVGLVLPLVGFLGQGGTLRDMPWMFIFMLLPAQLAMAISTSLPDEPSDRLTQKHTTVVKIGMKNAKILIVLLYFVSFIYVIVNQSFQLDKLGWDIFLVFIGALIFIQWHLIIKKAALPGSSALFYLVFLSILTNTALILGIALFFFNT